MTSLSKFDVKKCNVYRKQTLLKTNDLETLLCPSCGGLLRDPVQVTACGDRFCRRCIERLMSYSEGPYRCPVDNEEFVRSQVRTDRGCLKELQSLEIECITQPTPCNWRGPLTKLDVHQTECPNEEVNCSLGCGRHLLKSQLSSHVSSQCPNRPAECQYCKTSVPQSHLESHYQSCEEIPVKCDYCKKHLTSRKELERHLEAECGEYDITCPLDSKLDCNFQAKRPQMSDHMHQHNIQISELLVRALDKIDTLEAKVESLSQSQKNNDKKVEVLTKKLETVEKEMKEKDKVILGLEKQVQDHQDLETPLKLDLQRGGFVDRDCGITRNGHMMSSDESTFTSITRNATSSPHLKSLSCSVSQSRSTDAVVSRMIQEMDTQQTQLLKMSENLQTVQQSLTQHAVVIDEVRLRQDVLDVKTTNGVFIWKIPDIRRRFRDALDGRTISLYSPPFLTSPHGYRMCIRTYLNGDGIGKGTHMSVFFVLMRSEHDSLLTYPFKQSVRFTLINQANPTASITEAFVPDLNSPSFQRPEKDMNVASGFPKFARQSVLHDDNFTQGNVIYIKCQVDLSGLSSQ